MNVQIPYSWLKDHLNTKASAQEIYKNLSLCGPSVEKVETVADDFVFDIEITSNRVDTASIYGIAREASAILPMFGIDATLLPFSVSKPKISENKYSVEILDPDKLVRRALAVVVEIDKISESKEFIAARLEKCGVRSINNIVDITNYVMLEFGHPIHAFDFDRVSTSKLLFRKAKKGEKITTLEDKTYDLSAEDIIIDDGTGRIIDLPGIIGTQNSVITNDTKRVIFFVESNDKSSIRKTSMRHAIRTQAATINEKGPDIHLSIQAIHRAVEMAVNEYGAKVVSDIVDINHTSDLPKSITVPHETIVSKIGIDIDEKTIQTTLTKLGFNVKNSDKTYSIGVPSWRHDDIDVPEDIVEEVARIYGYFNLPCVVQTTDIVPQPLDYDRLFTYSLKVKTYLKHQGAHEVYSYSMISKDLIEKFEEKIELYLKLQNTISADIEYLRKSLVPSLAILAQQNSGFKSSLTLFEIANVYVPQKDNLPNEIRKICVITTEGFYFLKALVEGIARDIHAGEIEIIHTNSPTLHPSTASKFINSAGESIGFIGTLSPRIADNLGLKKELFVCEVDFEGLIEQAKSINSYAPYTQYAVIKRDITLTTDSSRPFNFYKNVLKTLPHLINWEYVGEYEGKVTIRLYFARQDKNLTEDVVDTSIKMLIS